MTLQVRSLASLGGSRIWHCHELWCRLQMQLRSGVAVTVVLAGRCSSYLTPGLGTSLRCRCDPKKTKKIRERELVLTSNSHHTALISCFYKYNQTHKRRKQKKKRLEEGLLVLWDSATFGIVRKAFPGGGSRVFSICRYP